MNAFNSYVGFFIAAPQIKEVVEHLFNGDFYHLFSSRPHLALEYSGKVCKHHRSLHIFKQITCFMALQLGPEIHTSLHLSGHEDPPEGFR